MEETNVFEIKMTETGMRYIRAMKRNFIVYLVLTLLFSLIYLGELAIFYHMGPYDKWYSVGGLVGLLAQALIIAGDIIIAILYIKFGRKTTGAYNDHDQEGFNRSFQLLHRISIIAVIVLTLGLVEVLLPLLQILHLYTRM